MLPPTTVVVPLLFGSVAIGSGAAILAWRERPNPGATPLVWLLGGQSVWATCIIFSLSAESVSGTLTWTKLGWIGVMIVPVAWILFALEYTGRDQYITRRNVALLSVVPVLTVCLAVTEQYHGLLYVRAAGVTADGAVVAEQGGVWYGVAAAYTYLLGVLGIVPILGLVSSRATAFRGQSAALLVGITTPWATNVLYNAGALPSAGIDPTPI
ncbi:histidine kinase N-terminal 7TM domain-containing protein, partial [Halorubrum sp. SD626R]|uniref:histidine kinase N-terminal 7TM domain-containing protein n=2 Tax=Halorubrum TaxID=56688 RepID=UPI0023B893BE